MPRSKYVTALDIGTTKICCVVGEPTERGLNIVGVGEAPSEGLRRGVVVNMEKTVRGITHAVDAAQRMCGHKLESCFVGMAGTHVLSQNSRGVIAVARSDREIGHEDVNRVIDAARAVSVPNDREIIHVVPRGYVVDGQEGVKDAVGMSGSRLEVETHIQRARPGCSTGRRGGWDDRRGALQRGQRGTYGGLAGGSHARDQ
ncbi:MAG: cell division protein FtsA [Chloroflexota bacterium]|nr:MAG: cell division protein FtsA [Chloroflexota bacterium]